MDFFVIFVLILENLFMIIIDLLLHHYLILNPIKSFWQVFLTLILNPTHSLFPNLFSLFVLIALHNPCCYINSTHILFSPMHHPFSSLNGENLSLYFLFPFLDLSHFIFYNFILSFILMPSQNILGLFDLVPENLYLSVILLNSISQKKSRFYKKRLLMNSLYVYILLNFLELMA